MKPNLALMMAVAFAVVLVSDTQSEPHTDALEKQIRELSQKRQELLGKQIELMKQQLDLLERRTPGSKAVLAMQSILDLKISQERVRNTLHGARIVAGDGTYLGRIAPSYDSESIFCTYGTYGATYSSKSIWCTYGEYGASYSELSPFCSYSSNPPSIIVDGQIVASLTVGWLGFPVSISPVALKALFADE